jgi:hypothetical protein
MKKFRKIWCTIVVPVLATGIMMLPVYFFEDWGFKVYWFIWWWLFFTTIMLEKLWGEEE